MLDSNTWSALYPYVALIVTPAVGLVGIWVGERLRRASNTESAARERDIARRGQVAAAAVSLITAVRQHLAFNMAKADHDRNTTMFNRKPAVGIQSLEGMIDDQCEALSRERDHLLAQRTKVNSDLSTAVALIQILCPHLHGRAHELARMAAKSDSPSVELELHVREFADAAAEYV
ncbi:hypothetical protein [Kocuria sp.]|uniref:hypothetical protein n=1 Tax=Kocuria sp. TaxID=1871328 RepID=UPI0026E0783B|nr:hypothetical protein [Kocuria sp.]MDO5618769.1 hypothetical protein [Kocuria sp.]